MNKFNDIMLDMETLSLAQNAVILSIGLVQFDLETGETGKTAHIKLKVLPQLLDGADISKDTVEWWSNQCDEAKKSLLSGSEVSPEKACKTINAWVNENFKDVSKVRLWGNGIANDNVWIRNLFNRYNVPFSIPYFCDNDVRTLTSLVDYDMVKELVGTFDGVAHDAIADCYNQINMCNIAYKLARGE